jgi:hypothetical protein
VDPDPPPEPPVPVSLPLPVEPRLVPVVEPTPDFDPAEDPVLLASATAARLSPLGSVGSVWAEVGVAGLASGPLERGETACDAGQARPKPDQNDNRYGHGT